MTEYFMLVLVRHEYRKLSYKKQAVRSGMYMGEALRLQVNSNNFAATNPYAKLKAPRL